MNRRQLVSSAVIAAATCAIPAVTLAQGTTATNFPTKPVRLVVPFSAGGVLDVLGRAIGTKLSEMWGQPVVIENRSGAGGALGAGQVAKATPDGYTLLITAAGFISLPALQPNLPYDPVKDFSGVANLGRNVIILVVSPSLGLKTAGDLVTLARNQPGKVIATSLGAGSGAYLNVEKFRLAAGLKIIHVGFKGQPEALVEIVAGRAHFTVMGMAPAMPMIKDGKLMALAVADTQRSPLMPGIPAITETPLTWRRDGSQSVLAPAGTPRPIVNKISKDIARVLEMPDIKERFNSIAFAIDYAGPEQLDRAVREDVTAVRKLVKDIGLVAK